MQGKQKLVCVLVALLALAGTASTADTSTEKHETLGFMVGNWTTSHTIPAGDGEPTVVRGEAVIEWVVGDRWLREEFRGDFPGRGEVFMTTMMNFSPDKKMFNFYLFDHFGGEAGTFYGDWNGDAGIVLTAKFLEEDGTTSYQKFTLKPVSANEIRINRAFSDDGEHYHFELEGVYTRK